MLLVPFLFPFFWWGDDEVVMIVDTGYGNRDLLTYIMWLVKWTLLLSSSVKWNFMYRTLMLLYIFFHCWDILPPSLWNQLVVYECRHTIIGCRDVSSCMPLSQRQLQLWDLWCGAWLGSTEVETIVGGWCGKWHNLTVIISFIGHSLWSTHYSDWLPHPGIVGSFTTEDIEI